MLRIDFGTGVIPDDYKDPYLELIHLLIQGAGLEQALMMTYLYSLFSIKDEYSAMKGELSPSSYLERDPSGRGGTTVVTGNPTFLDICLEEMQHLSIVNKFLSDLGASPNFVPHVYPYSSDVYPFSIEQRSLDRYMTATFLWIESDACALSQSKECRQGRRKADQKYVDEVRRVLRSGSTVFASREETLNEQKLNHLGSLYHKIIDVTNRVAENPPPFLPDTFAWAAWVERLHWVLYQGEIEHYNFFKTVFTGEAFGADASIWDHPESKEYPSIPFARYTAYKQHPNSIPNEDARRVAWLSDLQYWLILLLLDTSYRSQQRKLRYKAIDAMTRGLWQLGHHLARRWQVGMPFDQMAPIYTLGRNEECSLNIIGLLVREAQLVAQECERDGLLPAGFDSNTLSLILDGLDKPGPSAAALPRTMGS